MTRSAERPQFVVVALGSNLGDRAISLRRAIRELAAFVTLVKVSNLLETDPVDAPAGSPRFLNAVAVGHTRLAPPELLGMLQKVEQDLGRRRPSPLNSPRTIDLDLIFYGGRRIRTPGLSVPHPRWRERSFVVQPLRELRLPWLWDLRSMTTGELGG